MGGIRHHADGSSPWWRWHWLPCSRSNNVGERTGGRQRRRTSCTCRRPTSGAVRQIIELRLRGDRESPSLVREMIETPQAVWFTPGTPQIGAPRRPR